MVRIRWTKLAFLQLQTHTDYIREDSLKYADKAEIEILALVESLANNPEKYSLDLQKLNNNGSFRYFEKYRLRISYQVKTNEIVILRCRHTSMKPRSY